MDYYDTMVWEQTDGYEQRQESDEILRDVMDRVRRKIALAQKEMDAHVSEEERKFLERQQEHRASITEGTLLVEELGAPPAKVESMYGELERLERRAAALPVELVRPARLTLLREVD